MLLVTYDKNGGAHPVTTTFQVADVTRALWSVGLLCDNGLMVEFEKAGAAVKDRSGIGLCRFERAGGLYVTKVKAQNPLYKSFHGQGDGK